MAWMRFRKREMPEGLWTKCDVCKEMLFQKELLEAQKVCKKCGHHFRMSAQERIDSILDPESFEEVAADLEAVDSLGFSAKGQSYADKLKDEQKKTGRNDALVIGTGRLRGRPIVFGAMEFEFLGGSMGVGRETLYCGWGASARCVSPLAECGRLTEPAGSCDVIQSQVREARSAGGSCVSLRASRAPKRPSSWLSSRRNSGSASSRCSTISCSSASNAPSM